MIRKSTELEQLTLGQLVRIIKVREWWKFGSIQLVLLATVFGAGVNYGESRTTERLHLQANTYTVMAGVGVTIIGGEVTVSLDSYPDGQPQRLRLMSVEGWSTSPGGPFTREDGVDGPVYRPGSRTYVRLRNSSVWSIATLAVRATEIDIEVSGPFK